jgi:hypothetical protein
MLIAAVVGLWVLIGACATRLGVSRSLIPPWPESGPFYLHGAALGPLALIGIALEMRR